MQLWGLKANILSLACVVRLSVLSLYWGQSSSDANLSKPHTCITLFKTKKSGYPTHIRQWRWTICQADMELVYILASQPIGKYQSLWCVASTLSFDLRCGQCLVVHCTDDLRWLCVRQCTLFKIAVHSAEVRHTATTLAFTDLHDGSCYYFSIKNSYVFCSRHPQWRSQ